MTKYFEEKIAAAAASAGAPFIGMLARECGASSIDDLRAYADGRFGRTSVALELADALEGAAAGTGDAAGVMAAINDLRRQCSEAPGEADTARFFRAYRYAFGRDPEEEILNFLNAVELPEEEEEEEDGDEA